MLTILGKTETDPETLARSKVPRAKSKLKQCLTKFILDQKVTGIMGNFGHIYIYQLKINSMNKSCDTVNLQVVLRPISVDCCMNLECVF